MFLGNSVTASVNANCQVFLWHRCIEPLSERWWTTTIFLFNSGSIVNWILGFCWFKCSRKLFFSRHRQSEWNGKWPQISDWLKAIDYGCWSVLLTRTWPYDYPLVEKRTLKWWRILENLAKDINNINKTNTIQQPVIHI
jgi:hypothetical protein